MHYRRLVTSEEFISQCKDKGIIGEEVHTGYSQTTALKYALSSGSVICINNADSYKTPANIVDEMGMHLAYVDETDMYNYIKGSREFKDGYIVNKQ